MNRKITKIGNSYGVTLPADLLKEAGMEYGDEVQLSAEEGTIHLKKNRKVSLPDGISDDFFDVLKDTVSKYDKTINGLVER